METHITRQWYVTTMSPKKRDYDPLITGIDHDILKKMTDGYRETPVNLTATLNQHTADDHDRSYTAHRLSNLADRGYVGKVGPSPNSSMYWITTWGRITYNHFETYDRGYDDLFHSLVTRTATSQPEPDHTHPVTTWADTDDADTDTAPRFDPCSNTRTDWLTLTKPEYSALHTLHGTDGVAIPTQFPVDTIDALVTGDDNPETAARLLYTLHFYGLADRHDGMDAYSITDRGIEIVEHVDSETVLAGAPVSEILLNTTD